MEADGMLAGAKVRVAPREDAAWSRGGLAEAVLTGGFLLGRSADHPQAPHPSSGPHRRPLGVAWGPRPLWVGPPVRGVELPRPSLQHEASRAAPTSAAGPGRGQQAFVHLHALPDCPHEPRIHAVVRGGPGRLTAASTRETLPNLLRAPARDEVEELLELGVVGGAVHDLAEFSDQRFILLVGTGGPPRVFPPQLG